MATDVVVSVRDYDAEQSKYTLHGITLTAANFDAQVAAAINLIGEIDNVILGSKTQREIRAGIVRYAPGAVADKDAQRESKWLFRYYDATTYEWYTMEVPTADLSLLDDAAKGTMSKDAVINPNWATLKTAFEAYMRSPNGNAVVLEEVLHVARNI